MNPRSRIRSLSWRPARGSLRATVGATLIGLFGCSLTTALPDSEPVIRGTIRGPGDLGSLMVVADGHVNSCDVAERLQIQLGSARIRRRSGGEAHRNELTVGTLVSVWTTGAILDVCPGIARASVVVLEPSPP